MTELEAIKAVSDQYLKEGYTVAADREYDLAPFLEISGVDLIARKGDKIVAIEMQPRENEGLKPVVMAAGTIGEDNSLSLLQEAEKLLMPQTRRAALLMAWTAFEAAAREVLQDERQTVEQRTPALLIQELFDQGTISASDVEKLRQGMYLRNLTVHGVQPSELTSESIIFLLNTVRSLKRFDRIQSPWLPGEHVNTIRRELAQNLAIRPQIIEAVSLLDDVLGPAREQVFADWSLGEDGEGEKVIILKLSDLTGTVSGSFQLEELTRPVRLKSRLYKIWGDLLQIRITQQLEKLNDSRSQV